MTEAPVPEVPPAPEPVPEPWVPAEHDRVSWLVPLTAGAKPTRMLGTISEVRPNGQAEVIPDVGGPQRAWVIDTRSLTKEE